MAAEAAAPPVAPLSLLSIFQRRSRKECEGKIRRKMEVEGGDEIKDGETVRFVRVQWTPLCILREREMQRG